MENDLDELRQTLKKLSVSLEDVIEQSFHAHKLAERAIAAVSGTPPNPLGDAHIEDSKQAILRLLRKAKPAG